MIKFFRKIRKKLLSENKFRKYLYYAIGEIALVMIGILLALQVNNWNKNSKLNLKKEELKFNLINEFKENSEQLVALTEGNNNTIQNMDLFFKHAYEPKISISVDSLKSLAMAFSMGQNYSPELGFFEEAKSDGNLSLIKHRDLINAFTKFETHYELYLTFNERWFTSFYEGSVWEFRKSAGSITSLMNFDFGEYKNPIQKNLNQKAYFELINSNLTTALLENQYLIIFGVNYHLQKMSVASDEIVEILSKMKK